MIRFAVFTDLHYDHMFDGDRRIERFVAEIVRNNQERPLDFLVSLGDVCVPEEKNRHVRDLLKQTGLPIYYVIGNHDSDHCPQESTRRFWDMPDLNYSFTKGYVKFIVLNSCFMKKGDDCQTYFKKNYEKKSDVYPIIPDVELEWLRKEMEDPSLSYVLFSHHSLANEFARRGIANREEVRKIFRNRKVLFCMNGHDHGDACRVIDGIPYFTVNSMSYIWHGLKEMHVFDPKIHEAYPILKDLILYKDPLYAMVELEEEHVRILGMETEYLHVTPEEVGMEKRMWNGVSVEPRVSDWVSEEENV